VAVGPGGFVIESDGPSERAGAVWERSLFQMLSEAGFVEPTFHGCTGYFTSPYTQGGLITARKP
jgi:hypothetical protein